MPWAGDEKFVFTVRAYVASEATVRSVTEHQALDDLIDVGPLVWGNRVFQTQIVPAVPMIEEDLAEAVVAGGITWSSRRRPVQSIPSTVCCWTVGLCRWVGATPRG